MLFTTNDVAGILNVDKSTIKRWSDDGKLRCFRTPGGHRKFYSDDLLDFISKNQYDFRSLQRLPKFMSDKIVIRSIVHAKNFNILHSVCFSEAIKGNQQAIVTLFEEILWSGLPISQLFENIIKPTAKKLSVLRSQEKLSVVQFQLAHNVISSSIIRIHESKRKESSNPQLILCGSFDQTNNDIELTAMASMLEESGYSVINLGSGISAELVREHIIEAKPIGVCLHGSVTENKESAFIELNKILQTASGNNVRCLVHGIIFNDASILQKENVTGIASYEDFETLMLIR